MRRVLEQTHGVRYVPCKFGLDRFILSPSGSDKTQIFPFFGLRHFVVSPTAGNLIKLNMGAQLQTKASKSLTPSGAQTLTFKSVTNKHTHKLYVFGRSGGG